MGTFDLQNLIEGYRKNPSLYDEDIKSEMQSLRDCDKQEAEARASSDADWARRCLADAKDTRRIIEDRMAVMRQAYNRVRNEY